MNLLLQRVAELCKLRGLSYNALEDAAGLTRNSVNKWGTSMPSGDRILKVALFFDVSIDYLFGRTDNPKSHKSIPYNNFVASVTAMQQIKEAVQAQTADLSVTISALNDEKIAEEVKLNGPIE